MTSKKITFIVNPNSGKGRIGRKWQEIRSNARDRLGVFKTHITTGPGHASRLAHGAVLSGSE
ncbi:MAG: diacylglycerol kinase family protein, partial [Thermodesulfobacteriota bacterium]|nr:diacylglycerol kinase family protein [Thermodesulfobacteriota bacterium]